MSAPSVSAFRADIQGMRAVAVGAVLVFHVWPSALPGGYIGVDVFFVISGYLITGLLIRELESTGKIRLLEFYARRIRRLVPAASATLFAVAAATITWMSVADWPGVAKELVASAFYVQNLFLVGKQVDYLAVDAAPSPLLHYWSLSIEEQYYILWPVLMVVVAAAAQKFGWGLRRSLLQTLGALCLLSLAHAIHLSFVDPAPAYFLTTTRIWELGIGGILAILPDSSRLPRPVRSTAGWLGIAGISVAAAFYSNRLPFPGYEALLPTVGAALLLAASLGKESVLGRFLAAEPMQYLGAVSYSLYLWHWPAVIFYPYVTGRSPDTLQDGVLVVVVSILLAHLSRQLIEERFRRSRPAEKLRPYAIAGALGVGIASVSWVISAQSVSKAEAAFEGMVASPAHPGALVLLGGAVSSDPAEGFVPDASLARLDRGPAYGLDGSSRCIGSVKSVEISSCEYGSPESDTRIVIVGDSHAVHWLPALELVAKRTGWHVTGLTKSSCAFTDELIGISSSGSTRAYTECRVWGGKVVEQLLRDKPALVILSHSARHALPDGRRGQGDAEIAAGIVRHVSRLQEAGIKVAAIEHTPWQIQDVPRCMASPGATNESCSSPPADATYTGSIGELVAMQPGVALIPTLDYFCEQSACPVVIGNVLVYRDRHHLTATYAKSLAPIMEREIRNVL